jgi:hypothetical protein
MAVLVTPTGPSDLPRPEAIPRNPGRRRPTTVLRMGLAFFFPWPFGTDGLKAAVAARARGMRSFPARRPGKS